MAVNTTGLNLVACEGQWVMWARAAVYAGDGDGQCVGSVKAVCLSQEKQRRAEGWGGAAVAASASRQAVGRRLRLWFAQKLRLFRTIFAIPRRHDVR